MLSSLLNIFRSSGRWVKLRFETSDEAYQKRFDEIWNNDSIDINEKADRIAELERNDAFAMNNFVRWLHEYTNQLAGKNIV